MLSHQITDGFRCLDPIALRHTVVHQYELVHGLILFKAVQDFLNGLYAVGTGVAFVVELDKEALNRAAIERVIFNHEDLNHT